MVDVVNEVDMYEELSQERKDAQTAGILPQFYTTGGYQILKSKYLDEGETALDRYKSVAKTAAKHTDDPVKWEQRFFEVMWNGWLSPATPVLTNMGKPHKGMPVSCSGMYIGDSVYDFYGGQQEAAVLSKNGFGTAGYFGDIRPRGTKFAGGGKASGVLPVIKDFIQVSRDISQGSNRRGAWASYLPIDHPDFYEAADHLFHHPDDNNMGWVLTQNWYNAIREGNEDALKRWRKVLKIRATLGKGYLMKQWTVDEARPQMYKDKGLEVKSSQLCSEILLTSSEDLTYTCVLSSMNLKYWHDWKNTDAVYVARVFLDCVCQEFIEQAVKVKGLEKAVEYTKLSRSTGLGVLGLHTLYQDDMLPFESFDAMLLNAQIFKHLHDQCLSASQWMAENWGEPDWCKGYGVRGTHSIAVAPTMSTSLLMGGVSQGIEPIAMNVFTQVSAGGGIRRINPKLVELLKKYGKYNEATLKRIESNAGSVRDELYMTDLEREVLKTAFEINQKSLIQQASQRQKFICQAQSLNLFFDANESEEWISEVTQTFVEDPYLHTLYYQRGMQGVKASKGECVACEA